MKLLVAGTRDINDFDICGYIDAGVDTIICGGARGIDTIAEQYADEHRLSKIVLRPRYDLYGRAAPIRRNEEMVDMADAVLVIRNGIYSFASRPISSVTPCVLFCFRKTLAEQSALAY